MFPGGKDSRCVTLTTLPPSCADCLEILGPSTFWSPKGLSRNSFTFCVSLFWTFVHHHAHKFLSPVPSWARQKSLPYLTFHPLKLALPSHLHSNTAYRFLPGFVAKILYAFIISLTQPTTQFLNTSGNIWSCKQYLAKSTDHVFLRYTEFGKGVVETDVAQNRHYWCALVWSWCSIRYCTLIG